jgi:hypothetical protein
MRAKPTGKRSRIGTMILTDGTLDYQFKGPVRLNRSPRWAAAETYKQARDASPSHRPVR